MDSIPSKTKKKILHLSFEELELDSSKASCCSYLQPSIPSTILNMLPAIAYDGVELNGYENKNLFSSI